MKAHAISSQTHLETEFAIDDCEAHEEGVEARARCLFLSWRWQGGCRCCE